ncbi:hypothetical protein B2M20_00520 [Nitrobacter vulgaris]|uniref:Uncharacterized protein n=1 Tax=Nitrobacter vulgaris TaxID=29421 RepID=A0A1V4I340_NITVU|nr:hypothetical protein B2M20_00520 [Nitrobacter vulgaris]
MPLSGLLRSQRREIVTIEASSASPSLRAERSNPGATPKDWIASSLALLAMTMIQTHFISL